MLWKCGNIVSTGLREINEILGCVGLSIKTRTQFLQRREEILELASYKIAQA